MEASPPTFPQGRIASLQIDHDFGVPLRFAAHLAVDLAVDVVTLVDVFVMLHTAYIDSATTVLVTELPQIRSHQLRTWFFPDLIAAFPFSLVCAK